MLCSNEMLYIAVKVFALLGFTSTIATIAIVTAMAIMRNKYE